MRVLGVDPGLTRCGWGVVEGSPGRPLRMLGCDVMRTSPDTDLAGRLLQLATGIDDVLGEWQPDVVAVERVFSQHNVRTVMGVAQVSGVVVVAAARQDRAVVWHTPSEVKAAVTGAGRADKAQVATMTTRLLRLPKTPTPVDVTDALALAICQIWRGGAQRRLAAAAAR